MTVDDPLKILQKTTTTETYLHGLCTVVTTTEYYSHEESEKLIRYTVKVTKCGPFSFAWRVEQIVSNPYIIAPRYNLCPQELQPNWSIPPPVKAGAGAGTICGRVEP